MRSTAGLPVRNCVGRPPQRALPPGAWLLFPRRASFAAPLPVTVASAKQRGAPSKRLEKRERWLVLRAKLPMAAVSPDASGCVSLLYAIMLNGLMMLPTVTSSTPAYGSDCSCTTPQSSLPFNRTDSDRLRISGGEPRTPQQEQQQFTMLHSPICCDTKRVAPRQVLRTRVEQDRSGLCRRCHPFMGEGASQCPPRGSWSLNVKGPAPWRGPGGRVKRPSGASERNSLED
ncbi:uncharacterized protein EI97DRAFT_485289 [Westerdykella ornata]|uniref:Uncharacterized protein n=1 Tax=Westerdykella ornata TaxID=318751 RepID=A0A6A6J959_WESOR|nr:uncharacterized protein EI97DRAFT_485289 [Westerdykella ornata]KAF2272176.1 hypothetical protein EI97DRAFT_485289 [Westerdykella ornata]